MTYSIYKDEQKIEAWLLDGNQVNIEISYDGNALVSQSITLSDLEFLQLFNALKAEIDNS